MFRRLFNPPKSHSFFLFGARGTGKTTLLDQNYKIETDLSDDILYINLLDLDQEEIFSRNPVRLKEIISEKSDKLSKVIIDEIQKIPALLDIIHACIYKYKNIQFILTGSSARKLKHGGANLLAGRAFSFNLYPISFLELPVNYKLSDLLRWGGLPKVFEFKEDKDKQRFLRTYTQAYLKQEIQLEQLVRDIVSFREFLDLAAQTSGEIVNYSNIARQSGVDEKTVARYFEILVDTLIGFYLEPYSGSVRVRQSKSPKFYLFDTGIQRYLKQMSGIELVAGSSEFGNLFEQFILCECYKLNDYYERDFKFYYLRTKDGAEIDLIVKKPGKKQILIEIKSAKNILPKHIMHLNSLAKDLEHEEKWVLCNEPYARLTDEGIRILPWREGLKELFVD